VDWTQSGAEEWRRASFCQGGECVEVSISAHIVKVRDSKDRSSGGPVLSYTTDEWRAFTQGVRAGEFDL